MRKCTSGLSVCRTFDPLLKFPRIDWRVGSRIVMRCAVCSNVALSRWQEMQVESPTAVAVRTGCGHSLAVRRTLLRSATYAPSSTAARTASHAYGDLRMSGVRFPGIGLGCVGHGEDST